jgi:DNA (cytosine-5)-methyltransferase 1
VSIRELHLFAGAGGGILGGQLLGHRCVCAVEIDPYCRAVLLQRQRDGCLPWFPVWDDVCTFDGRPWRGMVDIVAGGFPCQDISSAGKGAGIEGERSGLWVQMVRIIREVRPKYAFVENSPALTGRGLGRVLGDLAEMGLNARWGVVSAQDAIWLAGDPAVYHQRERIWILASADAHGRIEGRGDQSRRRPRRGAVARGLGEVCGETPDGARLLEGRQEQRAIGERTGAGDQPETPDTGHRTESERPRSPRRQVEERSPERGESGSQGEVGANGNADSAPLITHAARGGSWDAVGQSDWWQLEPELGGVVHGLADVLDEPGAIAAGGVGRVAKSVADRTSRLKAIGNGQLPQVAALAWKILMNTKGD